MGIEKRISKAWLRVNGEQYECVAGSIKFNPGGEERTTVFSDQGVAGWTSKARAMSCEGSVLVGGAHDIPGFGKGEGCSLTLLLDTGQTLSSKNCWFTAPPDYAVDGSGACSFSIEGAPMEAA